MDYRPLEITVTRAHGLKNVNMLFKMRLYAAVSILGNSRARQETPIGKYVGKNFMWNFPMRFSVEETMLQQNGLMLMCQLRCSQILGGDKVIGEVYVPVKELFDNCSDENNPQYGTYQVVTPSGKRRGYLYFSYKFGKIVRAAIKNDYEMARKETLPDEIINEVLLKLPVKSLVRFKCLSKPWCVVISHPLFAKTHYLNGSTTYHNHRFFISSNIFFGNASPTNPVNLFATVSQKSFVPRSLLYRDQGNYQGNDNDDDKIDDSDAIKPIINFGIPSRRSRGNPSNIVGSCDGLICISRYSGWFTVLNPTTGDWKEISDRNELNDTYYNSREFYGFGYNSLLDDYKIVTINIQVNLPELAGPSRVMVCSLRTNSWKIIQEYCPYYLIGQWMGVYVSGALHWIAKDLNIVAFDLAEDEFKEVPLMFESKSVEMKTLGVHKGCLCMLQVEREDSSLILWKMVEYGVRESWTKLVIFKDILLCMDTFFPLNAENDKFLMVEINRLMWYNFNEETFERVRIKNFRESLWFQVIKYGESLISPLAYGDNVIDD